MWRGEHLSFDRVLRDMQREGVFSVDASSDSAERVHRIAREMSRKSGYAHAKLPSVPVGQPGLALWTSPAEILRHVGVATSFFRNSRFAEVARHWAQVRYCGTMRANEKSILTLTEEGGDVVYHHKVAQSEQLGIGFALVVAQESLRKQYPGWEFNPVDADLALQFGLPNTEPVRQKEQTNRRPDYFLIGHRRNGLGGAKIVVLECKGTHDTSGHVYSQLAKACSQVCSVEVSGKTPEGLMVASSFSPSGIKSHILDPPGDSDLWSGSGEEMDDLLDGEIGGPPEPFERRAPTDNEDLIEPSQVSKEADSPLSEEESEDVDRALSEDDQPASSEVVSIPESSRNWFFRILSNTAAASALLFAGAEGVAGKFGAQHPRDGGLALQPHDSDLGSAQQFRLDNTLECYGTRYTMPIPGGGLLHIDRGIEKTLYENLNDRRLGRYLRTAHRVKAWWDEMRRHRNPEEVVSVGYDGTVLRMRTQPE